MRKTVSEDNGRSTVSDAAIFLSKILRHQPGNYGIQLNSRGWASVKDVRKVLNREFDEKGGNLLKEVLDGDDKNRFQLVEDGTFGFVRATRGHTADGVELLEVEPKERELMWYVVRYNENEADYVEATSVEAVRRLLEERKSMYDVDWDDTIIAPAEGDIYIGDGTEPNDDLSGSEPPHRAFHQSGRKPLEVFKRINQMGIDIGRYFRTQPERVRSRLPPKED